MTTPGDDFPIKEPMRSSEASNAALRKFEYALAEAGVRGELMEMTLTHLSVLSSYIGDYFKAREDEAQEPYLSKDYPDVDPWSKRLRRPSSNKDPVHQSEHNVARSMHELLNHITQMPETDARRELLKAFRTLADELAHAGIYLDQGKSYANKSTMPDQKNDDLLPAKPRGHDALFTRINGLTSGGREP